MFNSLYIQQTSSTNTLLWEMIRKDDLPEGFVVYTDSQTAGKGQVGNSWESEFGKNLLFSMVLYPNQVPMDQLFLISQIVSLGIKNALDGVVHNITVKWPNDIYWNDKKLAGILIENSLKDNKIKTVVGVGLNVNQQLFMSDAPNPTSLKQLVGKSLNRKYLLNNICHNILKVYSELNIEDIRAEYAEALYRKDGFHSYKADDEIFQARIFAIHPDGKLELETTDGNYRSFYFKEVSCVV